MNPSSLEGLLVLDLSTILAGPLCGQLFADHGAEVIKVEPLQGDPNRSWPTIVGDLSTNFLSVNRGKKSLTLNLKSKGGHDTLMRLVRKADVVIVNYLPEVARRLGVSFEDLLAVNPDLIYISISGYGARGPLRNKPGYDTLVSGFTGLMSLTGEHDGRPVRIGVSAIDLATGMMAYGAGLTALHARREGRAKGQRIDLSLLETAVTMLGFHGLNWLMAGEVDQRWGAGYGPIVPFGAYACADGDIMIGAPSQDDWKRLCDALGAAHLIDDPRYADGDARRLHREELERDMTAILKSRTVAHWCARFDETRVSHSPIHTIDQVFEHEQVIANDMVVRTRNGDGKEIALLGLPFKMSATPGRPDVAPPALGEHTDELLGRHLGYAPAEIAALRADRAI